jgi:PAS domain S-box-containing protein
MERSAEDNDLLGSPVDLEYLYQNAPCGYFSLSPAGNIIKINHTLLQWLGYHQDQLIGHKFSHLLSKGGQMHFEMFFWPMATVNKGVKEFSYEVLRKDQTVLPVLLNASAKMDNDGKTVAVNVVLSDMTERKVFEKELLQSKKFAESEKKRLQFMADLAPEIIWTATPAGVIDYVNARFRQYFDSDNKETRSAFILSKVHKDDLKALIQEWRKSIQDGMPFQKEVRLINREGCYEWHIIKASLFLDEEGNLTNWFGSCSNINEHVLDLKKKDDFITIASHELKTPITSLKAILQLLDRIKGDPSNKMVPGLIEKANRNVVKVNALVDDLLNASQMKEGQLNLNKSAFNLSQVINDYLQPIRADNKYEIIVIGSDNITVFADEVRLEQVITNFITNAIKYAPESKTITISLVQTTDDTIVEVSDRGPGIPVDRLPYLFDRYYQVNNKGSKYSGLGLGLYICAEIVKKHGGKIGANSVDGEGSTFWFTLPNDSLK